MLANLRRRGISYSLNFIFGWDGETESAFGATLKFLQDHKVPVAYFNILTPVKGTPFYDRLQSEGRILNSQEIDRWPGQNLLHQAAVRNAGVTGEQRTQDVSGLLQPAVPWFPVCPCR